MRTLLLLVLLSASGTTVLESQSSETIRLTSSTVRVRSAEFTGVGKIYGVRADTLIVIPDDQSGRVLIPFSSIRRMELRRANTALEGSWKGTTYGIIAGGTIGAINVALTNQGQNPNYPNIVGGHVLLGATVGAIWGAMAPGTRWVSAPVPRVIEVLQPRASVSFGEGVGTIRLTLHH